MINKKAAAALKLAEAILAYELKKNAVWFGVVTPCIDPFLPFRAEQAGQLAYFKALGYECRAVTKERLRPGLSIVHGPAKPLSDEDKDKLGRALEKAIGASGGDYALS